MRRFQLQQNLHRPGTVSFNLVRLLTILAIISAIACSPKNESRVTVYHLEQGILKDTFQLYLLNEVKNDTTYQRFSILKPEDQDENFLDILECNIAWPKGSNNPWIVDNDHFCESSFDSVFFLINAMDTIEIRRYINNCAYIHGVMAVFYSPTLGPVALESGAGRSYVSVYQYPGSKNVSSLLLNIFRDKWQ